MDQTQRQCPIGAGTDGQPQLCRLGQFVGLGINDDQRGSGFHRVLDEKLQFSVRTGNGRVCAPDQNARRFHITVIVHPGKMPGTEFSRVLPGAKANQCAGGGRIGGVEHIAEPPELGKMMPSGAGEDGNALRAIGVSELIQLFRHFVIGFFPCYVNPFSAAPGADPLFGGQQPIRVIHLFYDTHALDTGTTLIQRTIRVRANLDHLSVFHGYNMHTSAVTATAGGFILFHGKVSFAFFFHYTGF